MLAFTAFEQDSFSRSCGGPSNLHNSLRSYPGIAYVGLAPNFSGGPKPKLGEAGREELKR